MKKIWLSTAIVVSVLICLNGIQAQNTQTASEQLGMFKQIIGTWQANVSKDTIEMWECKPYGEAFLVEVSQIIKGQKKPLYMNNIAFNSNDGKFNGYALFPNGNHVTWTGLFANNKKLSVEVMYNYNPTTIWQKMQADIVNPKEFNWTTYTNEGVKRSVLNFKKTK